MKCVLIMPPWQVTDVYAKEVAASQENFWQPLGLLYIGSSLLEAGHDVELFDGAFYTHEEILNHVRRIMPQFVGIYSNTPLWKKAIRTAEDIKKIDPHIHISLGGPAAIAWQEKCFEATNAFDVVHTGEGEHSAQGVATALEKGTPLKDVRGIVFREKDGSFVKTGSFGVIEDLDSLPFPARHLLKDLDRYLPVPGTYRQKPIMEVMSSRGCTNRCIYCFHTDKEKRIRVRSPENVLAEIDQCVTQYGVREIRFLDDNFTWDYKRAERICDMIKERNYGISWYAASRADTADFALFKKMRQSGCWAVLIGVESGVQKNLDALKKNVTVDQIRQTVGSAKKAGLKVYTPFIFGIPGETFADGLETIRFACELDGHYVNFHSLSPYPSTELYDNWQKLGTIVGDTDRYTFEGVPFVPFSMTAEEIVRLREIGFRKFFSRPGFVFRRLAEIRSWLELVAILKGAKSLFWLLVKRGILEPSRIGANKQQIKEPDAVRSYPHSTQ